MPRTYVRKDGARKYGYSNEAMQSAIKDVKENGMSIKKAAFFVQCQPHHPHEPSQGLPLWLSWQADCANPC